MSQIQIISQDFECSSRVINNKNQELNNLALKNHCLITITSSSQRKISPPTSKINSGLINISNGDLTTEQVKFERKQKKIKKYFF